MADKIITVDKFLGLNESADGTTELKPGEAAVLENFLITDEYNMRTRPGIVKYPIQQYDGLFFRTAFPIYEKDKLWLCCQNYDQARDFLDFNCDGNIVSFELSGFTRKVFPYSGQVLALWTDIWDKTGVPDNALEWVQCSYFSIAENKMDDRLPYEPLVLSGCAPSGGGKEIEKLNILTPRFRVSFQGNGESKEYILPPTVNVILAISYDGVHEGTYTEETTNLGEWNADTHVFTFKSAPEAQSEVIFHCATNDADLKTSMLRFLRMRHHEHFNGATDTRIFFYGDGTNTCYYTGVPAHGDGLYIPEGNELAVDFSNSPITGMIRHYSRLLAFKPDGVDAITYEPITLADGSVIPGFYLQPVSRAFGNDAMGQVCLVNNSPRSFTSNSIYEWRVSSGSYRDERYAKPVSQKVTKTIASADLSKVVAFDDNATQTYYVFLNDTAGTVLVNRYNLDCWSIYRSELTKNVSSAFTFDGKMLFISNSNLYTFDETALYDEGKLPIIAHYESGFLSFGADYRRKYSSRLWLSLMPQTASSLDITVKTDKRSDYLTKTVGYSLLDFSMLDFSNFSFETYSAPRIKRIQLKVKKFVYYKLILKVTKPGSRATILSYDQQIRFSSNAK